METNDDKRLNSLLQYHTSLIDQQFVDNICNKLQAKNKFRLKITITALVIACAIATPLLLSINESLDFLPLLSSFSPYAMTASLLAVLGLGAWLTSDEL